MRPTFSIADEPLLKKTQKKMQARSERSKNQPKDKTDNVTCNSKLKPLSFYLEKAENNMQKMNALADYICHSLAEQTDAWVVGYIKDNPKYRNIRLRYISLTNDLVLMHKESLIVVTKNGCVTLGQGHIGAMMFFFGDEENSKKIASLPSVQALTIANDCNTNGNKAIDELLFDRN